MRREARLHFVMVVLVSTGILPESDLLFRLAGFATKAVVSEQISHSDKGSPAERHATNDRFLLCFVVVVVLCDSNSISVISWR